MAIEKEPDSLVSRRDDEGGGCLSPGQLNSLRGVLAGGSFEKGVEIRDIHCPKCGSAEYVRRIVSGIPVPRSVEEQKLFEQKHVQRGCYDENPDNKFTCIRCNMDFPGKKVA